MMKDQRAGQRPAIQALRWRDRGYLPHWEKAGGIYHVTFRLADSLPKEILEGYIEERKNIIQKAQQLQRKLTEVETKRINQLYSERIERYLDAGKGRCYLRQPAIAEMAAKSLTYFDDQRYRLFSWCIMPNHVHVIFMPLGGYTLSKIVQNWKTFIARETNKKLNRRGVFWQREYYDHLIRDEEEFYRTMEYVMKNPERANLGDWEWVWGGDGFTSGFGR